MKKIAAALMCTILLVGCSGGAASSASAPANTVAPLEVNINGAIQTTGDNGYQIGQELNDRSVEIKPFQDYFFAPQVLTDDGYLIGQLYDWQNQTTRLGYGYYNINTKEEVLIDDTVGTSVYSYKYYLAKANDHIYYVDSNAEEVTDTVYAYDMNEKKSYFVRQVTYMGGYQNIFMQTYEDSLIFSLPQANKNGQIVNQMIITNPYTLQETMVCERMSGSPQLFNGVLYYLEIDNDNLITYLHAYDLKTNEDRMLIQRKDTDGYFFEILLSDTNMYFVVKTGAGGFTTGSEFYRYNTETNEMTMQMKMSNHIISGNHVGGHYLTFWTDAFVPKDFTHTMFYLFDLNTNRYIPYCGGKIIVSNKAIIWRRYNVDESTLGKFATKPGDVSFMYLEQ